MNEISKERLFKMVYFLDDLIYRGDIEDNRDKYEEWQITRAAIRRLIEPSGPGKGPVIFPNIVNAPMSGGPDLGPSSVEQAEPEKPAPPEPIKVTREFIKGFVEKELSEVAAGGKKIGVLSPVHLALVCVGIERFSRVLGISVEGVADQQRGWFRG